MNISYLAAAMGALLIVAGIGLAAYQTINAERTYRPNLMRISLTQWQFQTAYPGITMICIGALLLFGAAAFAPR